MEIVLASQLRTVHYSGGADEGLLRVLLEHHARLEVSVMDIPDRWGGGRNYFWEKGMPEPPDKPDWLKAVPMYQEGAPYHDILLQDWAWSSTDEFQRIVAFTGNKPPQMVILFGSACLVEVGLERAWEHNELKIKKHPIYQEIVMSHPAYTWTTHEGLQVGRWQPSLVSTLELDEAEKKIKANPINLT